LATKNNRQISILGCGWLGFPLAERLLEKGFSVKGSSTTEDKISSLENTGIDPYVLELSENGITGNTNGFLENSDILIIDIPPKLRGEQKENFVSKIRNLIPFVEKSEIKKVLFISSTAVYADDNSVVTEDTIPNPETESGKQLLASEKLLQSQTHFETTILRFGGLIGEDRHPIKFLAGKENLENPDGVVNLIHQNDCIGIILKIIETESWNEIFNAAAPFHPTREMYYTQKAIEKNLQLPKFNHEKPSIGKTIDSTKLIEKLRYTFQNL